jgi:phospholipase C
VYGPNGFVREFGGTLGRPGQAIPEVTQEYDVVNHTIRLLATNGGHRTTALVVRANTYRNDGPWSLSIEPGGQESREWSLIASHQWYDFTATGDHFERRFAGRLETGTHGFSDPAV